MDQITKNLLIKGRVQGVGFRYSLQFIANRLGLAGWVRNRRDGSVEALIQGEETSVQQVIQWAQQGPSNAHVEDVDVSDGSGDYSEFSILESV